MENKQPQAVILSMTRDGEKLCAAGGRISTQPLSLIHIYITAGPIPDKTDCGMGMVVIRMYDLKKLLKLQIGRASCRERE